MSWRNDLDIGRRVEAIFAKRIKDKYPQSYQIDGKCKGMDIYIPETRKGIEVKYDGKSEETGNIVIEVEMGGKPSGLLTTRSYLWIIVTNQDYCYISPRRIMTCILRHGIKRSRFTGPGDYDEKFVYFVKKDLLYKYAHKVVKIELEF